MDSPYEPGDREMGFRIEREIAEPMVAYEDWLYGSFEFDVWFAYLHKKRFELAHQICKETFGLQLLDACAAGTVLQMIDEFCDEWEGISSLLVDACSSGNQGHVLSMLLSVKADVNRLGALDPGDVTLNRLGRKINDPPMLFSPLMNASKTGNAWAVSKLIGTGVAEINLQAKPLPRLMVFPQIGTTWPNAVWIAVRYFHIEVVKMLLEAEADVGTCASDIRAPGMRERGGGRYSRTRKPRTLLGLAIEEATYKSLHSRSMSFPVEACNEMVRALVEGAADVNLCCPNGVSPLSLAMLKTNVPVSIGATLLELEANPNLTGQEGGVTPLHMAVSTCSTEKVQLLLDAKAKPNLEVEIDDRFEKENVLPGTALFTAVAAKDSQGSAKFIVAQLVAAKADVDKWCFHTSPLTLAARTGRLDVADALIRAKAALNQRPPDEVVLEWREGDGPGHVEEMLLDPVPLHFAAHARSSGHVAERARTCSY